MSKSESNVLLKGGEKKVFLENCKISYDGRIVNKKSLIDLTSDDQISIVSDAMFKTMLCSADRKKYICKLLAGLLKMPYEYIMENSDYYRNEFDKDVVDSKGERGDLVLKIENNYVLVEMNMTDETNRNVEYGDRLYRSKIKVGSEYVYPDVLSIFICNYYYEKYPTEAMHEFYVQTDEGLCLTNKTYLQIYIPILMKKWYTEGVESLDESEKTILTMSQTDRKSAEDLAEGDEILKDYVNEAKMVEKNDNFLREAYDHELSARRAEREAGFEEGLKEGRKSLKAEREVGYEEGLKEGRKSLKAEREAGYEEGLKESEATVQEIVKKMHSKGFSDAEIQDATGIDLNKIKAVLEDIE